MARRLPEPKSRASPSGPSRGAISQSPRRASRSSTGSFEVIDLSDSSDGVQRKSSTTYYPRAHGFNIEYKMTLKSRKTLDKAYFRANGLGNEGMSNGILAIAIKRTPPNLKLLQRSHIHKLYVVKISIKTDRARTQFTGKRDIMAKLSTSTGPGRDHVVSLVSSDATEPHGSWLAMPYLHGPNLKTFWQNKDGIKGQAIPPTFLYHFFLQMCEVMILPSREIRG